MIRGRWWLGATILAVLLAFGVLAVVMERATRQVSPAPSGQALWREGTSTFGATADQEVQGVTASPGAIPVGLVIASIGVDPPLTVKGVDERGEMEVSNGPEDVAWYEFSARPGQGGNVVLSGHVDYRGYGPAVFARLDELERGDLVELHAADGTLFSYGVTVAASYEVGSAPAEEILGPTARETVTLITCSGRFDQATRQYSHRLIVQAERLLGEPQAG